MTTKTKTARVTNTTARRRLGHEDERRLAETLEANLGDVYPARHVLLVGGRWWTDGNCLIRLFDTPVASYKATKPPGGEHWDADWEWAPSTFSGDKNAAWFAACRQTPCAAPDWDTRSAWLRADGSRRGVRVTDGDGERGANFNHHYVAALRDLVTPDRWTLADAPEDVDSPDGVLLLCAWQGEDLVGAVMPFVLRVWLREGESA